MYFCDDCNEKEGIDAIRMCKICDTYSCGRCRVSVMKEEEESNETCVGCIQIAGRLLMEENEKFREENKESRAEIKELKYQAGQMQDRNNCLREELRCQKIRVKELEEKMKQMSIRK